MHMHMQDHVKCWSYTFLTKRKALPNIDGVCIVGRKLHSSPMVSSSGMTYAIIVSVPAEEHNIHI
jgi:hypothetical protein